MKSTLKIITVLFVLHSCQSKFDGYTPIGDDAYFKLLSFENSTKFYAEGDYVSATIKVYDDKELKHRWFKYFPFPLTNNGFDKLLKELNVGDSVELRVSPSVFKDNSLGLEQEFKSDYLTVYVKIFNFYTQEEYALYQQHTDVEMVEQQIIKSYLKEEINIRLVGGVYVQSQESDITGKPIQKGMTLQLKYTGSFLTGNVFDSTFTHQTFEYVYGTPNQVIEGFDHALKTMKTGEKAKIIIPSQFAFGEDGSSTGIVPPYSTVVYNLEILNIN